MCISSPESRLVIRCFSADSTSVENVLRFEMEEFGVCQAKSVIIVRNADMLQCECILLHYLRGCFPLYQILSIYICIPANYLHQPTSLP
jgi:hypothetical protein